MAQRRHDENSSSDQSRPQILGFATFGSAYGSPAPGSDAETAVKALRRGELRAIYVDMQNWSEGVGRSLWVAAQAEMIKLGYS